MANESVKKTDTAKKSTKKTTTTAANKKSTTTKKVAEKKNATSKKVTSKNVESKGKTTAKTKATTTTPKKTVKTSKSTAATKKTAATATKTKTSADTVKKTVVEKKVVAKEPVKALAEKEGEISKKKEISTPLKKEEKIVNQDNHDVQEHFGVYLFLLSTILVCLHVMSRFHFNINDITIDYSVILFSSVYFVSNIITKKFDFKKSIVAIGVSALAMLAFVYFSRYLNTKVVDYFIVYGNVFAYIISQLLNLIIYYYLLVNTELKARWVYLTFLFSLAAYYFISILFSTRIIITDGFWPTFFCSFVLSGIIAIMYAFYDSLVRRGHE